METAPALWAGVIRSARTVSPVVRGWMNYYGHFYRSVLYPLLDRINTYVLRWIQKTYRVGTRG